jgi:hypothetical protein
LARTGLGSSAMLKSCDIDRRNFLAKLTLPGLAGPGGAGEGMSARKQMNAFDLLVVGVLAYSAAAACPDDTAANEKPL